MFQLYNTNMLIKLPIFEKILFLNLIFLYKYIVLERVLGLEGHINLR